MLHMVSPCTCVDNTTGADGQGDDISSTTSGGSDEEGESDREVSTTDKEEAAKAAKEKEMSFL